MFNQSLNELGLNLNSDLSFEELSQLVKLTEEKIKNTKIDKEKLVDRVIEQLKEDLEIGDYTVLDEILHNVSDEVLINSLPEDEWPKFKK